MAERRNIPWTTVAVEAIAIVVSILLAFAIDAWWTERNERENEQSALLALRSDLEASREQLVVVLRSLKSARQAFARFQSLTPAELAEFDSENTRLTLTGLVKNHTFDPVNTTLEALANDGRLGLISDPELLRQLSGLQTELDNIEDISFELRAESVMARRAMQIHGGPFFRWRRSLDDLEVLQRADGETLATLRQDELFMGTARSHQYALVVYLAALVGLAESLDRIVELLDQITARD